MGAISVMQFLACLCKLSCGKGRYGEWHSYNRIYHVFVAIQARVKDGSQSAAAASAAAYYLARLRACRVAMETNLVRRRGST